MNIFKRYLDYINDNPKGYWFKRKGFGWGWTPATWQGWIITCAYIALILLFALTIDNESPTKEVFFTFIFPVTLLTIAFIRIAYKKGQSPKWQWGFGDIDESKDEHDAPLAENEVIINDIPLADSPVVPEEKI